MRDPLHVCFARHALRLAVIGAVLVSASPVSAAGKVLRPQVADRIEDPGVTERRPAAVAPTPAIASNPAAAPGPQGTRPSNAKADPNSAEPLSERASAAAERAKRALSDEDAGDYEPEPVPLAAGQPVEPDQRRKAAATLSKPEAKCLAGC